MQGVVFTPENPQQGSPPPNNVIGKCQFSSKLQNPSLKYK